MHLETRLRPSVIPLAQRLIGASMIMGPLLGLIGFLFHPLEHGQGLAELQLIAHHAMRWNVAHSLFLFSMPFLITGALGLMMLVRQHAQGLALVGTSLVVLGAIFFSALFGTELALGAIASVSSSQYTGIVPAVEAIAAGKGALSIGVLGVAFNVGLILLAIALWMDKTVSRWSSICIGGGALLLTSAAATDTFGAASFAILLIGLGPIGLQLLRQPL